MTAYYDSAETLVGDRVIIEDLRIPASIGIYPHEKIQKQTIALDIEMGLAKQACFRSDRVEDTIDYAAVADALRELTASRHFNLIEFLAEQISNVIFDRFGASWTKVRISKIGVIPDARCAAVAIARLNANSFGTAFSSTSSVAAQNEEPV